MRNRVMFNYNIDCSDLYTLISTIFSTIMKIDL